MVWLLVVPLLLLLVLSVIGLSGFGVEVTCHHCGRVLDVGGPLWWLVLVRSIRRHDRECAERKGS